MTLLNWSKAAYSGEGKVIELALDRASRRIGMIMALAVSLVLVMSV